MSSWLQRAWLLLHHYNYYETKFKESVRIMMLLGFFQVHIRELCGFWFMVILRVCQRFRDRITEAKLITAVQLPQSVI